MATQHNFRIKNGLEIAGVQRISSAGVITGALDSNTTATTQSASDNSTKIATTAYTDAAITAVIGGAPGTLDTLNELAAAINDDASYASTLTTALAGKLPLAGGTLTGALTVTGDANPALEISRGSANTTNVNLKYNTTLTGQISAANEKFQISAAGSGTEMEFYVNGAKRLEINTSGYVGIVQNSSSSISHPLHITKEIAGYQAYFNNDNGSAQGVKVRIKSNDSGNFNMLELVSASTGSDVTAMVVRDDGNVGIGTTSPASLLDLRKTTAGSITGGSGNKGAVLTLHHEAQWENGYTGGDWLGAIDFSTGDGSVGEGIRASIRATSDNYYNTNSLGFYVADQGDTTLDLRMIIKDDGEVGIGRLPENAKVHILGNSSYVGNHGYSTLCLEDTSGYAGLNLRSGNNQWLIRNDGSSNALQIVNSSNASGPGVGSHSNRFEIEAGGDVKVGATGSGNAYKLEVYDGDYTTMMLRGPNYPTLKFKADNQNSGQNGSISIGASGAIYMNPNNSTTGIYVGYDGVFNASSRQYYHATYGEHHVRTGGRHGTGTYTLFTNGSSSTQSAGIVEVWGIYGTPSGASYRMYVISGNRSIATAVAHTQTNSIPIPVLAWSGANLQISNSNGSLYYHVRVTLQDIGISWAPTWGNFPGIN